MDRIQFYSFCGRLMFSQSARFKMIGPITPMGGTVMILGYLSLAF